MDTFIVVFVGCLCTMGSAQYNVQPIPETIPTSQEMPIETIIIPKLNDINKTTNNKKSVTVETPVTAPLVFPSDNTTYHFIKNQTIENELLSHSNNSNVANVTHTPLSEIAPTDPTKNQTYINATEHENAAKNDTTPNSNPMIIPPKIFPTDTTKYKFKSNKTTEEIFLSKNTNHVDTEVPDLLSKKHYDGEFDVDQIDPNLTTIKSVIINSKQNWSAAIELMDNVSMIDKHYGHDHLTNGKTQVAHGPLAGILIGVLLLVALVGYAALVLWRRSLEIKYGTRERLVNEEDFDPHYDNRFEL